MPTSKDQNTQSDGKRTAQDDVEQATIEFPGAKAESPDAADELAMLSQRIMPDEEFGIVYPGSGKEPKSEGDRAGDCSERPNTRGRI